MPLSPTEPSTFLVRPGGVARPRRHDGVIDDGVTVVADRRPDATPPPFSGFFAAHDDPGACAARALEAEVFAEAFATEPVDLAAAMAPYEAHSVYACVVDNSTGATVGVARLLPANAGGFKTVHDLERVWHRGVASLPDLAAALRHPARVWDIPTLAVAAEYRRGFVSQALHQLVCTAAARARIERFLCILDVRVHRLLQFQLARMFEPLDGLEPRMYDGSISVPVQAHLPRYRERLRRSQPRLDRTLFEGRNVEAAFALPDWASLPSALTRRR